MGFIEVTDYYFGKRLPFPMLMRADAQCARRLERTKFSGEVQYLHNTAFHMVRNAPMPTGVQEYTGKWTVFGQDS